MKELISDFKAIYHNDRKVLVTMMILLVLGVVLAMIAILNLTPAVPKVVVKYSDIVSSGRGGYVEGSWWYMLSWSVLALVVSVAHCLVGARLYAKRGASVALMFLWISVTIALVAISYLLKILGRG